MHGVYTSTETIMDVHELMESIYNWCIHALMIITYAIFLSSGHWFKHSVGILVAGATTLKESPKLYLNNVSYIRYTNYTAFIYMHAA